MAIMMLPTALFYVLCIGSASATPCKQVPKPHIDEQMLVVNSPFTAFYSSWSLFKCASTSYVYPQTGETGYNLTGIVTSGTVATTVHLALRNNNAWDANFCNSGLRLLDYATILVDFEDDSKSFCVSACDSDVLPYTNTVCWGKTQADKQKLKQFYEENEIPNMMDLQEGCNNLCAAVDQVMSAIPIGLPKIGLPGL